MWQVNAQGTRSWRYRLSIPLGKVKGFVGNHGCDEGEGEAFAKFCGAAKSIY